MTLEETIEGTVRKVVREELLELRELLTPKPVPSPSARLTVDQVAEMCGGRSPETVRGWIHSKKLVALRVEGRWLVKLADLERFMAREAEQTARGSTTEGRLEQALSRIAQAGGRR